LDAIVSELLAHLQSTSFADLAGARVSARVPVSRVLLNQLVARALQGRTTPVRRVEIRPYDGDKLDAVVTLTLPLVPPLKVAVAVERQPQFPDSPVLVLRWSLLAGLGTFLSKLIGPHQKMPPGVRLDGDRVLVDIRAAAAGTPAAQVLGYVKGLEVHTAADRLIIAADLEVSGLKLGDKLSPLG
jgi:hypothetical protein